MKYLTNTLKILTQHQEDLNQYIKITTVTFEEAKKKILSGDGFESLIDNENSAHIISQSFNMNIPCNKGSKELTPYDTLIVAQPKGIGLS